MISCLMQTKLTRVLFRSPGDPVARVARRGAGLAVARVTMGTERKRAARDGTPGLTVRFDIRESKRASLGSSG